ncbi:MAG: DNA polymerase III subunit delta [Sphaerochaetaceae bacterium]|jgi:DNA polymerase-3 subunit delta
MTTKNQRTYLLLGPEAGEKSHYLNGIRKALFQEFGEEVELYRFYPFEALEGELIEALMSDSLFSSHRLVIVSQVEDLQAKQVDELEQYLKDPSDNATLVFITQGYNISKKLASFVPPHNKKIFYEMFENRKAEWLRDLFRSHSAHISHEAIQLLLELVENNTQELRQVAMQLIQFAHQEEQGGNIEEESVERFIQHTRSESVFTLFEQIALGSYERSLAIINTLMQSEPNSAISLIGGLVWQWRRLASLHELLATPMNFEEAVIQVKVGSTSSAIKGKKNQNIYLQATKNYSLEATQRVIARLSEYDIALRQWGLDFHHLLLERLVGIIINRKGVTPPQYAPLSLTTAARF